MRRKAPWPSGGTVGGSTLRPVLFDNPGRRRGRGDRFFGWAFSIAVNLAAIAGLFWWRADQPLARAELALAPIEVSLVKPPSPPAPPQPAPPGLPAAVRPAVPRAAEPVITEIAVTDTADLLSSSQLAGAVGAEAADGGGGGGGGCDTARRVQQALQRDPLVRAAAEDAHRLGKSVMLWDGDWVQTGGQDGKGLSAVREAVTWELAFAPKPCLARRMHGLVLLSLGDGTRFAVGGEDWRWQDLLGLGQASPPQ